jgi:hypothetical protein
VVPHCVTLAGMWDLGLKTQIEHRVLVTGTPRGMAVGSNVGRWLDGTYKVVVVWWCHVWSRKRGGGGFGQKLESEPPGLGFGCAIGTCG